MTREWERLHYSLAPFPIWRACPKRPWRICGWWINIFCFTWGPQKYVQKKFIFLSKKIKSYLGHDKPSAATPINSCFSQTISYSEWEAEADRVQAISYSKWESPSLTFPFAWFISYFHDCIYCNFWFISSNFWFISRLARCNIPYTVYDI